jgi:hypothetical protein
MLIGESLIPGAVNTPQVPPAANEPGKPGSTPPNWRVLRTAIGPAILAGQLAVRSTRTQYLGRGSLCLLPGLLQGTPHEHAGHGTLIVGGTTRIANGIGLLLRYGSRLAQQLGR